MTNDTSMRRRGFLGGLLFAPAVIRTPGLLMPIKAPAALRLLTLAEYAEAILAPAHEAFAEQIADQMMKGICILPGHWHDMPRFGVIPLDEFFANDE